MLRRHTGPPAAATCTDLSGWTTRDIRAALKDVRTRIAKRHGSVFLVETLAAGVGQAGGDKAVSVATLCCKILVDDHDRRRRRKRKKAACDGDEGGGGSGRT